MTKALFITTFKTNLTALVQGYLTRKYKRGFPLNKQCSQCNKHIKGSIHREEEIHPNFFLVIYKSDNVEENKGHTTLCFTPISTSIKMNDKYYCYECSKNLCHNSNECPICLEHIENSISTKCSHNFCLKCIIHWIKIDNKDNVLFSAVCPVCKETI
tara:strand:- start:391 stop:861 length:471 start_codon:yes stop_codon:yes gene_type:complete